MSDFYDRIIRAAKLDVYLYEEVEADQGAMGQAMGVVVLSSVAAGIGTFSKGGLGGIIIGTIGALIGWFVWAYIIYLVGTKLIPEPETKSDTGELLRTIGFSSSPGVIRVIGVIPGLTGLVFFIAALWMLAAMVIAVKQALDFTGIARAIVVCLIGWCVQIMIVLALFAIIASLSGTLSP
jgi:hypothetical protein